MEPPDWDEQTKQTFQVNQIGDYSYSDFVIPESF